MDFQISRSAVVFDSNSAICPSRSSGCLSTARRRHIPLRAIVPTCPLGPTIFSPFLCAAVGAQAKSCVIWSGSRSSPEIRNVARERCTCAMEARVSDALGVYASKALMTSSMFKATESKCRCRRGRRKLIRLRACASNSMSMARSRESPEIGSPSGSRGGGRPRIARIERSLGDARWAAVVFAEDAGGSWGSSRF